MMKVITIGPISPTGPAKPSRPGIPGNPLQFKFSIFHLHLSKTQ
jgi:hypothetical protein